MANIKQLIGKINPNLYAVNGKGLLKKYKDSENIPAGEIVPKPLAEYELGYDSTSETLEPIYFFILDLMNDFGFNVVKLVDNFSSSPGSGHFSEMGQRATLMQQQGTKLLGDVNTVLRSVLNIIYDLKEFKIRLQNYDESRAKDDAKKGAAILGLKQLWMDKVDMLKGNSSIKALAMQGGFQPVIDAFLVVQNEKDVHKLDLNDRIKRILLPRINEFNLWLDHSEKELRKRYELEKTYLKSQVNSLKLYTRWAKPYLKAANDLERTEKIGEPSLVKVFNTILLELTILGKSPINVKDAALEGELPIEFQKLKTKRAYYKCTLVDFNFRGIPQKISQSSHYSFGGKADVTFSSYVLNEDELSKLKDLLIDSESDDVLSLVEAMTTESLGPLKDEINSFLDEVKEEEKEEGSNPFVALVGGYEKRADKKSNPEKNKKIGKIRPDDYIEREHLREYASGKSKEITFKLFDVYKKSHGMASYT
jgi:hypothetical protein